MTGGHDKGKIALLLHYEWGRIAIEEFLYCVFDDLVPVCAITGKKPKLANFSIVLLMYSAK
jgi:hypothetical protein